MHYYLGADIGSVSSNFILMDQYNNIREKVYLRTLGNPVNAIKEGLAQIKSRQGGELDIRGVGTTGSGRHLADVLLGADVVKNEITAHAVAASALFPGVRTIIEIGGQDSKIIMLKNGMCNFDEYSMCCRYWFFSGSAGSPFKYSHRGFW